MLNSTGGSTMTPLAKEVWEHLKKTRLGDKCQTRKVSSKHTKTPSGKVFSYIEHILVVPAKGAAGVWVEFAEQLAIFNIKS